MGEGAEGNFSASLNSYSSSVDEPAQDLITLSSRLASHNILHHTDKLLVVDLAVSILVDLPDRLIELSLGVDIAEFLASQQRQQLARLDRSTVVLVEHLERCLHIRVTEEHSLVHSSRQKLYRTLKERESDKIS